MLKPTNKKTKFLLKIADISLNNIIFY